MKRTSLFISMVAATFFFTACGSPAPDSASSDAETTRSAADAPAADALLDLERQAHEAYITGDSEFFDGLLSDRFVLLAGGARMGKADVVGMIGGVECDVEEGWTLTEPHMSRIDDDTYALTYTVSMEGTCTTNGGTEAVPSPVRASTVWVRDGDDWRAVFHGENLIIDAQNPPEATPTAVAPDGAATERGSVPPASDPLTDALMAAEKSVWEAWRTHDAEKIEDLTADEIAFVNIFGTYFADKAATVADWTSEACDVESFTLADGVATPVSPTVGVLTLKGTADGACGGQDISGQMIYGTSVYVKEGDVWKWAFGFNSPS